MAGPAGSSRDREIWGYGQDDIDPKKLLMSCEVWK